VKDALGMLNYGPAQKKEQLNKCGNHDESIYRGMPEAAVADLPPHDVNLS
jgi:hypothetical protein